MISFMLCFVFFAAFFLVGIAVFGVLCAIAGSFFALLFGLTFKIVLVFIFMYGLYKLLQCCFGGKR